MANYKIDVDSFSSVAPSAIIALAQEKVEILKPVSDDMFRDDAAQCGFWSVSPYFKGHTFLAVFNDELNVHENDADGKFIESTTIGKVIE